MCGTYTVVAADRKSRRLPIPARLLEAVSNCQEINDWKSILFIFEEMQLRSQHKVQPKIQKYCINPIRPQK